MIDPLGKQTTPEAVYEAAQQFVWAFKNMQWNYAKVACERLQRTIEAVYWPHEQSSSALDKCIKCGKPVDTADPYNQHICIPSTAFPKCPICGSEYAPLARCACGKNPPAPL